MPGSIPPHHDDDHGGADGTLPIALGFGAGAESRRTLGVCVVGGLMFSQVVTLYLTPVVYLYMEEATQWMARVFGRKHAAEADSSHGPVPSGPVGSPIARISTPDLRESGPSNPPKKHFGQD